MICFRMSCGFPLAWLLASVAACLSAAEPKRDHFAGMAVEYQQQVQPLLKEFCLNCHSTAKQEAELDLEQFKSLVDVRRGMKSWLKVTEMLDNGEMPPKPEKQPTTRQRKLLRDWVARYLQAEALANAGDPGPVVLRRLNNAEYTYTIRDLTGVDLDPAREFPTDNAAGEGFTNAGNALSMSPALLAKYLDAGKEIASHVVLLPDGFRFSKYSTQRDWTDELLGKISRFYRDRVEVIDLGTGESVGVINPPGPVGLAGRLPLEKYFAATIVERKAIVSGRKTVATVAAERGLNGKYLGLLWSSLNATEPSPLFDDLRTHWRTARPEDAKALVAEAGRWQRGLWTFNPIGLMGRKGSRPLWQEAADPVVTKQEFRLPLLADKLRELESIKKSLADVERYQDMSAGGRVLVPREFRSSAGASGKINSDASVLVSNLRAKDTYIVKAIAPEGVDIRFVRLEALTDPSLPANGPGYHAGDELGVGKGNFVINRFSAAYSPPGSQSDPVPVKFVAAKADFERSGFPVSWTLKETVLKGWSIHPAAGQDHVATFEVASDVRIPAGSLLTIAIEQNYSNAHRLGKFRLSVTSALAPPQDRKSPAHDALVAQRERIEKFINDSETEISLVVSDCGDGNDQDYVVWQQPRLIADKQPDILLRDIPGLRGIDRNQFGRHPKGQAIDAASLCVRAPAVIRLRVPTKLALSRSLATTAIIDPDAGKQASVQPDVVIGKGDTSAGLIPSTVTVTLSTVTALYPDRRTVQFRNPILLPEGSLLRPLLESSMHAHRQLFPSSLCYPKIVPNDEALTLTQFYREDEPLVRLLLNDVEKREIDRLWEELRYVSQDPLKLASVLDSLVETTKGHPQDGGFNDAIVPFHQRADAFRKRLVETEPAQIAALLEFAGRAYRRPLNDRESADLRGLYRRLRDEQISHDEAFRLTLAKILVASPFLYRLESVPAGSSSTAISDWELASRLSYFLWSSQPDGELRAAAASGTLSHPEVLERQTRRMLKEARIRRLGTEFGCQWLHIHDFPVTESKSQQLFPEFADLRGDMYEESILFLTDLFQKDASFPEFLNADHTFVNERMAKFYGVKGVEGTAWRRIDGINRHGRGGILGLSTILAKQSGASRTSPILRGNWVSEVLLGEKLPRPPKNVPQLADTVPAGLTERQMIERHSSDVACAKCHQRVDPLGFSLEGFDAIGRRRERSQAGVPLDTKSKLPDGRTIEGMPGLRNYLLEHRRDAVVRQFCRKLLGYALGRETQPSDQPLLTEMQQKLAEKQYRLSTAILAIVQSRQFREIRGRDSLSEAMH